MGVQKTTSEFIEDLYDCNENYREGKFTIMSTYLSASSPITVKDKYGLGSMKPNNLLSGKSPSIKSAANKTSYFTKMAKEVHGQRYDYSQVEFIKNSEKVTIVCSKHGEFKATPNKHLSIGTGCPECGNERVSTLRRDNPSGYNLSNWITAAEGSKNFDCYKIYFIKCWNDEEEFYKIGRTYTTVERRFKTKFALPYKYELLSEIINEDPKFIWEEENRLKVLNKDNRYIPKLKFNGMYECFNKLSYDS